MEPRTGSCGSAVLAWCKLLIFRLVQFQIQFHQLVAIEDADRFPRARHSIRLSTQFIVDVCAKAKKMVRAVRPGYVRPHLQSLGVLQENDRAGNRGAIFTQYGAFDRPGERLAARRSHGRLHLSRAYVTRDND